MPNTKQQMADLAKKMARQMAQEPGEILKNTTEQVVGTEAQKEKEQQASPRLNHPQNNGSNMGEYEKKTKAKDTSLLRALENEAKDIRLQNLLKDLQARITSGEQISLEEYPELSMDQKQVLKSQMEAVRIRNAQAQQSNNVPQISSKQSRRLGGGRTQKAAAEREQTRVEKPVPPSG